MKRLFITLICTAATAAAIAQIPQQSVDLTRMTFVRQSSGRNFYNTSKTMSRLATDGAQLFLPNSADLITVGDGPRPTIVQQGRALVMNGGDTPSAATVRIGAFHPYLCYEVRFGDMSAGSRAGVDFFTNDGRGTIIRTTYDSGSVASALIENGDTTEIARKATVPADGIALRIQYTGMRFHVFRLHDDGSAELLYSVLHDMRRIESCTTHSFGVHVSLPKAGRVTVNDARSLLACGTGQADPQIIQYRDGSPLIRDGRLYVCFTTRGFERIADSCQGVYSLDLDSYELRLEGALFFGKGDGLMYGFHATKVVYDPDSGKYMVMTTTHEDTHTLAFAETDADLLHGMHFLECEELEFPHSYTRGRGYNTEDPDFFFDAEAGRWRLAYCALKDKSYVTYLCESDRWNGPYTLIAESPRDNNTGIRITTVGGRRYVLSGGPDTTFYIYDYPTLRYEGTFRQQYANGGFRGWPTIVPLPYGNYERYLWITFDRGAQTGRYSYGTLYFYLGDSMWRRE